MVPINYLAVLVSAIATMALGYVWYGPLFGKQWRSLMGWEHQDIDTSTQPIFWQQYVMQALAALIMAYALAHSIIYAGSYLHQNGVIAGLQGALWSWLGFIAPVSLSLILWDNKPWMLWAIHAGYFFVSLLIMGLILGFWA